MGQSLIDFAKSSGKAQNTDKGGPKAAARRGKPDYRGTKGPASLRFNNPGAQWPGPISKKWGAVDSVNLKDGQGNKIAVFGDAVTGGAALYDLLATRYTGKTLKAAIAKWSGGNSSKAYAQRISKATGLGLNEVITPDLLRDPNFAVPFAMEMANHEMGGKYPMSADDWAAAHQMFSAGSPQAAATESFGRGGADVAGMGLMTGGPIATGAPSGNAMDGGALGLFSGGLNAPSDAAPTAPAGNTTSPIGAGFSGPLSGDFGMSGMQGMGRPGAASQIARALSMPSMDAGLMGGAPAPASPQAPPDATEVSLVSEQDIKDAYPGWAGFDAPTPAPEPLSVDVTDGYGKAREGLASAASMGRKAAALGDMAAKQALVAGDLYGQESTPSLPAMTEPANMSALNAPTTAAQFGALPGMGSPPTALGLVSPIGDVTSADSFGFSPGAPSFGTAMSLSAPSMSISDVSPAAASAMGSEFGGFAPTGPSDMSAAENFGAATGSFGGIGSPTSDQATASFEHGFQQGLSAAASPPDPVQKADVFAPGLRAFDAAFQGSVKSVGPKYSKAIAAALATPSIANQVAVTNAAKAYSNMNGQPSRAVKGLRSQQIGDYAMANPALGNALGLSIGQSGTNALGGGGAFGGIGGPTGPSAGPMGGTGGGGPGQPSGPSFSGPSGPSAGPGGGFGGPTGQPSGPSRSGPTGPAAGPGGGYSGGGNPAGSPRPGGVTTGRGPSSNPGSGGGLSASAAAAIGRALADRAAADAAASSDAARGFGFGGFF